MIDYFIIKIIFNVKKMRSWKNEPSPPRRRVIESELDEHTQRIKELLRGDILLLEEENQILRSRCRKTADLEEKVQMVLHNNDMLQIQNEKLIRIISQQGKQIDLLKEEANTYLQEYEKIDEERKKSLSKVESLKNETESLKNEKNAQQKYLTGQIKQMSYKNEKNVQKLIKENEQNKREFGDQLSLLREKLQNKDREIMSQNSKIKSLTQNYQKQILQLKGQVNSLDEKRRMLEREIQTLKENYKKDVEAAADKLEMVQRNNRKDVESARDKLELIERSHKKQLESTKGELQLIQKSHLKYKQDCQRKLNKLQKDRESLAGQNAILKENQKKKQTQYERYRLQSEQMIQKLTRENENLRNQLFKIEDINKQEFQQLKNLFAQKYEREIYDFKVSQQHVLEGMKVEIYRLQQIIHDKDKEIELNVEERASLKNILVKKGNDLKDELQTLLVEHKKAECNLKDQLTKKQLEISSLLDAIDKGKLDIADLKDKVEEQKNELQNMKQEFDRKQQDYKESINEWKKSCVDLKSCSDRISEENKKQKQQIEQVLKNKMSSIQQQMSKTKSSNIKLQKQNENLRNTLLTRDTKIKELEEKLAECFRIIEQRETQIDLLREKLVENERAKTKGIHEQRDILEKKNAQKLKYLTNDFNARIMLLENNLRIKDNDLKNKEQEMNQLLKMYHKMKNQMIQLSEQEANKKQMSLKFPGATSDLIATKNLFDSFLKAKTIEYTGEVIENKENFHQQ